MKPICFMIMPYGKKATQSESGQGVATIDFNALWDRAYAPVIKELGYDPVRADQDVGALIITQMIERLYFADLVLAEMTIPNGNVYYEVGVRHAAREKGCVLLAADWSKQLFDVAQMRTIRYPLSDGDVGETAAQAIRAAIKPKIEALAKGGSPVFESIKGYPFDIDEADASTMKDAMADMAALQGRIRAVRALPLSQRMSKAKAVAVEAGQPSPTAPTTLAVIRLLKDSADTADDWTWITDFVAHLPAEIASLEEVRETNAFALANAGKPIEAIAKLEELMTLSGATPERLGLLGGRYKRLVAKAAPAERLVYLNKSIDAYERGMEIDLNQYYCSSNLPRLYLQRNRKGDRERAVAVSQVVVIACERARKRNEADEWLRKTLLGAAFDAGDADKAEELATDVLAEGAARWQLETTMSDLESTVLLVHDPDTKNRLTTVLEILKTAVA
jgi:Tetratricopeptide Repeats-Sensor